MIELDPAEDLLDQLALALTLPEAGTGAFRFGQEVGPLGVGGELGHVRCNAPGAQLLDEAGVLVALVGTEHDLPGAVGEPVQ